MRDPTRQFCGAGDPGDRTSGFGSACPPEVHAFIEPVNDAANAAVGLVELVRKSISEAAIEALRGERDLERRLLATDDLFRRRLYGPDPGSPIDLPSESHPLDPSWDDVQKEYLLHVRNDAPGRPEWDDIISGKWYDDVLSAWMALISACTVFLREKQEAK